MDDEEDDEDDEEFGLSWCNQTQYQWIVGSIGTVVVRFDVIDLLIFTDLVHDELGYERDPMYTWR